MDLSLSMTVEAASFMDARSKVLARAEEVFDGQPCAVESIKAFVEVDNYMYFIATVKQGYGLPKDNPVLTKLAEDFRTNSGEFADIEVE